MTTIGRQEFIESYSDKEVDTEALRGSHPNLGVADADNDGKIRGADEVSRLFTAIDTLDRNGSRNSVDAARVPVRRALDAVANAAAPTRGMSTGPAQIAREKLSNYQGGVGDITAFKENGRTAAFSFKADMDTDTDGGSSAESRSDPHYQSETSMRLGGKSLDADKLPFIVLPPSLAQKTGAKLGDLVEVEQNGKKLYGIYGDNGPSSKIGEASMKMAKFFDPSASPNRAAKGTFNYTVLPGSGARSGIRNGGPAVSHDDIQRLGAQAFAGARARAVIPSDVSTQAPAPAPVVDGSTGVQPQTSTPNLDARMNAGETLSSGDSGDDVKEAQQLLIKRGFDCGPHADDGDFGPATRRAVERFQESRSMPKTGILGADEWRALKKIEVPNPTIGPADAPSTENGVPVVKVAPKSMTEDQKFDHYAAIVRAQGGEVNPGGKPTILGIRGMDINGKPNSKSNTRAYDDTFVILTADRKVVEMRGASHSAQKVSNFEEAKRQGIGRINPGNYTASANGNHNGMPSYRVKTLDGSGLIPGVRDKNKDGIYSESEIANSGARGDKMSGILFHVGFQDTPKSVGCLTFPPEVMNKIIKAAGNRGFSFTLAET